MAKTLEQSFNDLGFKRTSTGGGFEAYERATQDHGWWLITDEDSPNQLPGGTTVTVQCGRYDVEGYLRAMVTVTLVALFAGAVVLEED